jgi:membrane peptidoglycan carboxypeptidase
MRQLKMISKDEAEKAKQEDTLSKIRPFTQPIDSPHFVFYAKEQLEKLYGKETVEQGGLRVYTTLDWEKQRLAEKIVAEKIVTIGKDYGAENASLCAIDPKTGEILAMVGSKNYFDRSIDGQVNVTISPRQPGSSFKPFAYAAAFEAGYQPETILYDLPANFGPDGTGEDYKPNNYNGNFSGPVSMRQALAMSLNIPAVKTLYLAGINNTLALAEKMGISTLSDKSRFGLAVVLGGAEVTLLEETSAFSVFANDGKRNPATPFLKIENSRGEIIFQNQAKNEQVINSEVARKINSILSDNSARAPVFGTNNKLVIPGRQIAAKTGTTQDFHDAWTVGFTPGLAAGVWVGNNDNAAMDTGADGSYVAAPIWNEFMTKALENYPNENFVEYDKSQAERMRKMTSFPKVVYINKKSGKEISEKKAKKTDSDKVGVKIEYPNNWGTSGEFLFPEMQDTNDPMILRWKASLNDPELLSKLGKNEDEDED